MSTGSEFSTRGKPCSSCGHRKTSHAKTGWHGYCQSLGCKCEGFVARQAPVTSGERAPSTILADLCSLASRVAETPDEITASYGDRIGMLCAEMEAAITQLMLTASIAGRKK